ncbi:MAG TPA: YaeQ family protein [Gemmatimonadaceae bacterium]|nr:YaeQ family protein [Gemmatimonadaceae bacterium]
MALTATVYTFEVQLSDVDRGVYETFSMKVAQQPSETDEYMIARVLAYCLEYREGITFSKGLAEPDEPAIAVRDLTGTMLVWVDIGAPAAARLHKASKLARRVVVYTHKDAERLAEQLRGERIHRQEELEIVALDRSLIAGVIERLDRRVKLDVSVTEGHLYVTLGGATFDAALERLRIA